MDVDFLILKLICLLVAIRLLSIRFFFFSISYLSSGHVILTGDFTNFSLEEEFEFARSSLSPILDPVTLSNNSEGKVFSPISQFRTFLLPGNHDYYTKSSSKLGLFEKYFGDWGCTPYRKDITTHKISNTIESKGYGEIIKLSNDLNLIGLNPCRPTNLNARGFYDEKQLTLLSQSLDSLISSSDLSSSFLLLCTHYPLLDSTNSNYSISHSSHGVVNNEKLIKILNSKAKTISTNITTDFAIKPSPSSSSPAPTTPTVSSSSGFAMMVLHGHVHNGYPSSLFSSSIPIYNPGSAGYSSLPSSPSGASYNIYTIEKESGNIKKEIEEARQWREKEKKNLAGKNQLKSVKGGWLVVKDDLSNSTNNIRVIPRFAFSAVHLLNGWVIGVERFVQDETDESFKRQFYPYQKV